MLSPLSVLYERFCLFAFSLVPDFFSVTAIHQRISQRSNLTPRGEELEARCEVREEEELEYDAQERS